ncbi:hypothetical protein O181_029557 [Austropuccinia psidii MF-1]|uniref:Uncharacterized protein n=1 Tax=Austropuccinia psidii MF-1 TaxID=1389203 RepID=A0A9Q3CWU2_9BASI|nr:hypothetical protein [Austropuccinia psidii MF-1]
MEHGQQEVQPSIPLGRTWRKVPEDMAQTDRLQRPYGNNQGLESYQELQTSGAEGNQDKENQATIQAIEEQLTQTGHTQIPSGSKGVYQTSSPVASHNSGTHISVAKSHHSLQSQVLSGGRQGYKGENKTSFKQRQRGISKLNSDELWLEMSQDAEKTQKQFAELQESHEPMKTLTASMDKIVKTLQEGHAQLSKTSEETNKSLNKVFEEQDNCKRDRDFLDQDLNKLFNVYQNVKPWRKNGRRD